MTGLSWHKVLHGLCSLHSMTCTCISMNVQGDVCSVAVCPCAVPAHLIAPSIRPHIGACTLVHPITPCAIIDIAAGIRKFACPMHLVVLPFSSVFVLSICVLTCTVRLHILHTIMMCRIEVYDIDSLLMLGTLQADKCIKHLDRAS